MDIVKTILTSWPLATVIIVFAIRGSLKKIIENRLFSLKVGNVEIAFDKLIKEADEGLNHYDKNLQEKLQSKSDKTDEEHGDEQTEADQNDDEKMPLLTLNELKEIRKNTKTPKETILYSWFLVSSELRDFANSIGEQNLEDDIDIIMTLWVKKAITDDLAKALNTLNEIYNEFKVVKLKKYQVNEFLKKCLIAKKQLQNAKEFWLGRG
ncbi:MULTISPECIES: hypothetical protein [Bacillus]|uniref:Uncharacterized protein n=1 Tax=Bacillus cabrialesii subsp. tritici TaxID=2944916 RepID=A0ABT9DMA9_9BACI|nr:MULTISPECIES: hypothetical protein [Bacillus]MCY7827682.1 hypothetical protein [Bacillus spizizenii]MCY7841544.1 hypothetical protein [Bacillus spizizenii]MCY7964983.1 hypothetical protein [Bacillus inaquosorum]MCY8126774.1 hypothetical protein [Bacillus spizizenii]MCY8227408.1 hypothetical protein [Bacillus spizizenii]